MRTPCIVLIVSLVFAAATTSCVPFGSAVPVTPARTRELVDNLIFSPGITCDELKKSFGVDALPSIDWPDQIGLDYETHFLPTEDGQVLHAWYLPAQRERGTVVLAMGAAGSIACYLFTARVLVANGWSVVMYDYRGFGGSSGVPEIAAIVFDFNTVLDWTLAYTGQEKVTLAGISLGSIPTIATAVQRPQHVNGLILDSPVILGDELRRLDLFIGDIANDYAANLDPEVRSDELIEHLTLPLLVFLDERDLLTPPDMVQELFDRAQGPKQLVRFPGIGHARAIFFETEKYIVPLEEFLSNIWGDVPLQQLPAASPALLVE